MKKLIIFFILLFYSNSFYSQLNYNNLIKIANAKIENIEMFMMDNFGMVIYEDNSKGVNINKKFTNIYGGLDDTIVISVLNDGKHNQNLLDIHTGKNIDLTYLKSQLLQNGYIYKGKSEFGNAYLGNEFIITIKNLNNSIDSVQTFVMPISYKD